ncbi:flavin-containing monooxygenase [Rhodococcus artemisiae]|uniref:NAD(P)/FAD-dependent oxidoreductase n=1 Tax=Rhodococcus artemisiae TaxID=714159 RepID=A0ABU7LGM0_9NOCA|nr:NAD(P)/FAD-dependent oxidoreductase [Rhodococcus artemisiae]MEE2060710.1 NAD(P)/FAD-dependent oxidoreductase [Rhodococcus artemisiae]
MEWDAVVIGGGQAGLAVARELTQRGLSTTLLEKRATTAGSWRDYYDSLTLFTPAHLNSLRGEPFPGSPHRYPSGIEVAEYLESYAKSLTAEVRTGFTVERVSRRREHFLIHGAGGETVASRAVISATGGFSNPRRPHIPALDEFTGEVIHAAEYRSPERFGDHSVVVVGAGNSAVQIAVELSAYSRVVLASRHPIHYATNTPIPPNSRFWTWLSRAGRLPIGRWFGHTPIPVVDTQGYKQMIDDGAPERREMFVGARESVLRWADEREDKVDTVILATGYRPALGHLAGLEQFDTQGFPLHRSGISRIHKGLAYVGLEYQRTMLSGTLHGADQDAAYVARRIAETLG